MKRIVWLLPSLLLAAGLFLACKQDKRPPVIPPDKPAVASDLFPGEVRDPKWPQPIIVVVRDTLCSTAVRCPSLGEDCVTKTFSVQKDTAYALTVSYFNGDTVNASCRACACVTQGTISVMNVVTSCPTGGPWVTYTRLEPGLTYTLSVCLQRCPKFEDCRCGERAIADAVVSIRHQFN